MPIETFAGIAAQSPYLAALLVMGWVFNRYHIESLRERKEILQSLTAERQEFIASRDRLIERYATDLTKSTEAQVNNSNQMHNLRGDLTKQMLAHDSNQREIMSILYELREWMRRQTGGHDAKKS